MCKIYLHILGINKYIYDNQLVAQTLKMAWCMVIKLEIQDNKIFHPPNIH